MSALRLTKAEVAERYRCHVGTVMRRVREGKFPKPHRFGEYGWPYWLVSALDAFDAEMAEKAMLAPAVGKSKKVPKAPPEPEPAPLDPLDRPVSSLGLAAPALRALASDGIRTIADLCEMTPASLMRLRGFGVDSLDRVARGLAALGLRLRDVEREPAREAKEKEVA
jgi:hypothetical protein